MSELGAGVGASVEVQGGLVRHIIYFDVGGGRYIHSMRFPNGWFILAGETGLPKAKNAMLTSHPDLTNTIRNLETGYHG